MGVCSPPVIFATWVSLIYTVYSTCNLIPQILRLFELGPACKLIAIAGVRLDPSDGNCLLHHHYRLDPHGHQSSLHELLCVIFVFHFFFIMFMLSLWKVTACEPGWIPDDTRWRGGVKDEIDKADEDRIGRIFSNVEHNLQPEDLAFIKNLLVVERKMQNGRMRECAQCRLYKPDRSHHCHVCARCVMRMDHHCVWIANCVGFNNYKFFLLMLFYSLLTVGTIIGSMLPRFVHVFRPILDFKYFILMDLTVFITYCLAVLIFSNVLPFFLFHLYLATNAMTTIEMREKQNAEVKEIRYCFKLAHVKYDQGYWRNFCHIFGPPYMWFVPLTAPSDIGFDGTYAKKEDIYFLNK